MLSLTVLVLFLSCYNVEIFNVHASFVLGAIPLLWSQSRSFLLPLSITLSLITPIYAFNPETSYAHDMKKQKFAIKAWSKMLSEKDYNASEWARTMRRQPQNFFDYYVQKLSDLFLEKDAIVNFALVGACDGTNDNTIRDRYIPNYHWHGVFVEPFSINFRDLNIFMEKYDLMNRTHLIQAGATSRCNSSTIKMKRPDYEEKNQSYPHWMRRQIGAVVPYNKLDRPMTGGWMAEYVRCVTGDDILRDWAEALRRSVPTAAKTIKKMRAHVLKIDVEGHDYDVLMSFLPENVPNHELPLLINFEAKSIAGQFPLAKEAMEKRGYVVSNFATDGFALLRGDRIYSNNAPPARAASRKAAVPEEEEVVVEKEEGEKEEREEEGGASEDGEGSRKKPRAEKSAGSNEYAEDKGSEDSEVKERRGKRRSGGGKRSGGKGRGRGRGRGRGKKAAIESY